MHLPTLEIGQDVILVFFKEAKPDTINQKVAKSTFYIHIYGEILDRNISQLIKERDVYK